MSDTESLRWESRNGGLIIRTLNRGILERKEATIKAIAHLIRTQRAKAALVDLSGIPGEATFMDRFELGQQAGQQLPRIPIAALLRDQQSDPQRIGQLVAQNRGMNIEVFLDATSAEAWFEKHTQPCRQEQG